MCPSRNTNFMIGRTNFNLTERIRLSLPAGASITRPNGHRHLEVFSSMIRTTSPIDIFFLTYNHLLLVHVSLGETLNNLSSWAGGWGSDHSLTSSLLAFAIGRLLTIASTSLNTSIRLVDYFITWYLFHICFYILWFIFYTSSYYIWLVGVSLMKSGFVARFRGCCFPLNVGPCLDGFRPINTGFRWHYWEH